MSKNYYITFDVPEGSEQQYNSPVPTILKTRYICSKFNGNLNVVSLASKKNIGLGKKKRMSYGVLKTLFSFGVHTKIGKWLDTILRKTYLFFFLIFVVKKRDKVLIYHSSYTNCISKFLTAKKCISVLEVEEIYGYDAIGDKSSLQDEIKSILKFKKYIFVNDYIPVEFDIDKKDFVVCYGVVDSNYKKHEKTFNKNKIHILYAGTIEDRKLGAFSTAHAANFLSNNYVMHIAGFGKEASLEKLREIIENNNRDNEKCMIEFHGMLSGEELNKLIDNCDIGVSAYIMRSNFANNSLPSKIMTYMTHDLHIVSGYSEAIADSKIAKNWQFFYNHDPESIANAIKSVDVSEKIDNSQLLKEIDDNLFEFLKNEGFIE